MNGEDRFCFRPVVSPGDGGGCGRQERGRGWTRLRGGTTGEQKESRGGEGFQETSGAVHVQLCFEDTRSGVTAKRAGN